VLLATQSYEEAVGVLEPLVVMEHPHDGASFALAQALRRAGRAEAALPVLEGLITRSSSHPEAHFLLGLLKEELEDERGAEQAYRKEIELRPGFIPAYLNLAVVLAQTDRKQEALELLHKALELEPPTDQADKIQQAIEELQKIS
jgi:Flp pilus assembly protein TadD